MPIKKKSLLGIMREGFVNGFFETLGILVALIVVIRLAGGELRVTNSPNSFTVKIDLQKQTGKD